MKEDLVSIVVPVYNCEKFIRQTKNKLIIIGSFY